MTPTLRARVIAQLQADEGCRLAPYLDTRGRVTVGYGRNLTDKPLTPREAEYLFANDVDDAIEAVLGRWPWIGTLAEPRVAVVIEMAYNLGGAGIAEFRRMIAALREGDFDAAAAEILDSDAARAPEPGLRARYARFARQMRVGEWPG